MAAGGQLTYTLTVSNTGNLAANGVVLTDQLPSRRFARVSNPSARDSVNVELGQWHVTANLLTVPAGGTATLTIVVTTSTSSVGTITDTGVGFGPGK